MTGLLLKAVSAGRCRQVRMMLDSGQDLEQRDECKQSPLIRAIFLEHSHRREKMLKLLLKYDAKTSSADAVGRNALSWACLYGHARDVDVLLENADVDLDLNKADMNGETALFHAATSGSAATVKLMVNALRKYSLSMDVANFEGVTPLMQATCLLHDVCAAIIQNGGGTVGVNSLMTMEEELETAERWAVKSNKANIRHSNKESNCKGRGNTRNNPSRGTQKPPRFPPIIPQAVLQKIKFRENRAFQQRVNTPVDSEDDSYHGSEVSYYTEKSFDSINLNSPRSEQFRFSEETSRWGFGRSDRLSIMSVSQTSSTENNLSSDDEGSDKIFRRNKTREPEDRVFQVTQNLPAFFRVYEELNSPAYRPPVRPRDDRCHSPVDSTSSDSVCGGSSPSPSRSKKTGSKAKKVQNRVVELRKKLLRKQGQKDYDESSHGTSSFPTYMSELSSGSDAESETYIFSGKSVLPRIIKASPLVSDDEYKQPMKANYSEN